MTGGWSWVSLSFWASGILVFLKSSNILLSVNAWSTYLFAKSCSRLLISFSHTSFAIASSFSLTSSSAFLVALASLVGLPPGGFHLPPFASLLPFGKDLPLLFIFCPLRGF